VYSEFKSDVVLLPYHGRVHFASSAVLEKPYEVVVMTATLRSLTTAAGRWFLQVIGTYRPRVDRRFDPAPPILVQ